MEGESTVKPVYKPKRAEDYSWIARFGSFALKWQWVALVLYALWQQAGFGFTTPAKKFTQIEAQIEKNKLEAEARWRSTVSRMDTVDRNVNEGLSLLEGLALDACNRLRNDPYARLKLKCQQSGR